MLLREPLNFRLAMLKIKKMWAEVKLTENKETSLSRWRRTEESSPADRHGIRMEGKEKRRPVRKGTQEAKEVSREGRTQQEREEEKERRRRELERSQWREHKLKVRQNYRQELSEMKRQDREREERREQERREMERWQREERAKLRRALREEEEEEQRRRRRSEPAHSYQRVREDGGRPERSFLSALRPAWLWCRGSRVAPSEGRQLNWFNPPDGEKGPDQTPTIPSASAPLGLLRGFTEDFFFYVSFNCRRIH